MYFFACCMVAGGTLMSATWIIAANSWMQTPAGAVADAQGIYHAVDWWQVIFNPSFPYRVAHMVCASVLTGSFVVAGVSAFHLWQRQHLAASRAAFSMAMWMALVLAPLQIGLGDLHGRNTLVHQPTKVAAMEGLWDTTRGAPMTVFAWPDMQAETNRFAIDIPHIASLYLTHSWNGEVPGLKAVPRDDRPYVPIVFFAFRIMVGIGIVLLATAITGAVLRWRGRLYETRWFQLLAMAVTPLGFLAVLAGWTTTEAGRQPFVIYGYLRTADAVAPVSAGAVTTTLLIFFAVYNVLLIAFFWFAARIALKGPAADPREVRPGLDRSGPTLVGAGAAEPGLGGLAPTPGE
jgi:cytochrome d ubiquinol oxidase subunit I